MGPVDGTAIRSINDIGNGSVEFSPDGTTLVAESNKDGRDVILLDARTGDTLRTFENREWVNAVAESRDGSMIAAGALDGVVRVWNSKMGALVATMPGLAEIRDIAFSPDGRYLATASDDRAIRLWDAKSFTELYVVATAKTTNQGMYVGFGPGAASLVATTGDGELRSFVLPVGRLLSIAEARVHRGLTNQECRQYLHASACPSPS
jgi:WD40 repeat protein